VTISNLAEYPTSASLEVDAELKAALEHRDPQSLERLEAQVHAHPGWPDLRFQLARRLFILGRYEEALSHLDEALSINQQFMEAIRLKVRILTDRGELKLALKACRRLNSFNRDDSEAFLAEGILLARMGEHGNAIGAARNALDIDRKNVEAHLLLGEQYLFLKDVRLARRHLDLAMKLRPTDEISYMNALVCLKQDDVVGAEKALALALEDNPKHLSSMVRWAMLKINEGDFPEAYRLLSQAVVFYPNYPDLHYGLARVCLLMGKRDDAYRLMTAAIELNPKYAEARREIVHLCDSDDLDEAIDHSLQSVIADPHDEQAVINLSHVYDRKGEQARAIEVLERAVERFPDSWRILQTLGILQLQRRVFPKAKLAFEGATRINPDLVSVERSLRIVFQDESLLEVERERILSEHPSAADRPLVDLKLGRLYLDFHRESLASQHFRQAFDVDFMRETASALLATVHAHRSDFVTAIRWLDCVQATGIYENVRRLLLGLFHANAGDHEASSRYYQQVMTDSPLLFHALDGVAVCFREREELEDMLDDYLAYARSHDQGGPLLRRLGWAFANKGMLVEARRHFDHATIVDPADARAFHSLGVLTLLRMDVPGALERFRVASICDPNWGLPQLGMALAHLELGHREEAILGLQRYVHIEPLDHWREAAAAMHEKLQVRST
jgi:tetratricopeptide (TPR) repeat protein